MVYSDEILIYSKTLEEHMGHLESVFCVLRKAIGMQTMTNVVFVWKEFPFLDIL